LVEVCFHFVLKTYTEENEATQKYKYFILEIFIPVKQVSFDSSLLADITCIIAY
jgi:hypothetical protein